MALAGLLSSGAALAQPLERRVEEYSRSVETQRGVAEYSLKCEPSASGFDGAVLVPPEEKVEAYDRVSDFLAARERANPDGFSWSMDRGSSDSPFFFHVEGDSFSCKPLEALVMPSEAVAPSGGVRSASGQAVSPSTDRAYLQAIADMTTTTTPGTMNPTDVNYSFAGSCGEVQGLALIGQSTRTNIYDNNHETGLYFTVRTGVSTANGTDNGIVLVRDDRNTDFVSVNDQYRISVSVGNATISNVVGSAGSASAQANLSYTGGCGRSVQDIHAFSVLTKQMRNRWCDNLNDQGGTTCYNRHTIVYGTAPNYVIDSTGKNWSGVDLGLMAGNLTANRDGSGALINSLSAIDVPRTTVQIDAGMYFTHPQPYGTMWGPLDPGFTPLTMLGGSPSTQSATVQFGPLLQGTTWNHLP